MYSLDLQRSEKTYYLPNGDSLVVPVARIGITPALSFSATGVETAVREIQSNKIVYQEFCTRIAASGCIGYFVSLAGKRAVYLGRTGESYVEPFPQAQ